MALKGLMARGIQSATATSGTGTASTLSSERNGPATETPRPIRTQAPGPRTVAPSTSVDASSEFEGKLRCNETLRIDGRIKGEIECEKTVIVGEGARVYACVDADEVQIAGIVEGDIAARRKITLERTAVVVGDLTTPGIVIEEGAKLQGRILIGSDAEADAAVKADAKAEAATAEKAPGKAAEKSEENAQAASDSKVDAAKAPAEAKDASGASSSAKKSSKPNGTRAESPKVPQAAAPAS